MKENTMEFYYGTKLIQAEPMLDYDGVEGYKVIYSGGYESWSPTEAFEAAYRKNGELNFGHALEALKSGKKIARSGWNGKSMWLNLQTPDEHSKMTLPYIYMFTACKNQVPWFASQTDVLANDWCIVE